jgi:hypothetical protein
MTGRVRMSFTVKEFSGGQPWICLEPVKEDLIVLANGFLGFDLPVETTIEKVKKSVNFWKRRSRPYLTRSCISQCRYPRG